MTTPNLTRRKKSTIAICCDIDDTPEPCPELKPCAHCGSSAKMVSLETRKGYYVACSKDKMKGAETCSIETAIYDTQEDAAHVWNRRTK